MSVAGAPVRTIFIIRHGEKPPKSGYGPDVYGRPNEHSLIPRGWQRAAALAMLFAPPDGVLRSGLSTPTELIAPDYGDPDANIAHRTHQTILPLARLLGLQIETVEPGGKKVKFKEGDERAVGEWAAKERTGITLICWEHDNLHLIADNIPTPHGTKIPKEWTKDRFDVIWSLTFDSASGEYHFTQIPQMILEGDTDTTIPVT